MDRLAAAEACTTRNTAEGRNSAAMIYTETGRLVDLEARQSGMKSPRMEECGLPRRL
jgi:hypothetical protein